MTYDEINIIRVADNAPLTIKAANLWGRNLETIEALKDKGFVTRRLGCTGNLIVTITDTGRAALHGAA